jgi:hypothetical protein
MGGVMQTKPIILIGVFLGITTLAGCCSQVESVKTDTKVTEHTVTITPPVIIDTLPMIPVLWPTEPIVSQSSGDRQVTSEPKNRVKMIAIKIVGKDTTARAVYDPDKETLSLWVKPQPIPFQYSDTATTSVKETIYKPSWFQNLVSHVNFIGFGFALGVASIIVLLVFNRIKRWIPL